MDDLDRCPRCGQPGPGDPVWDYDEARPERPTWQHHDGDRYFPIFGDYYGNPTDGYEKHWNGLAEPQPTRPLAELEGLRSQGSDDFNIAVVRGGRVIALLWMTEDMGEEQAVLDQITDELGGWLGAVA